MAATKSEAENSERVEEIIQSSTEETEEREPAVALDSNRSRPLREDVRLEKIEQEKPGGGLQRKRRMRKKRTKKMLLNLNQREGRVLWGVTQSIRRVAVSLSPGVLNHSDSVLSKIVAQKVEKQFAQSEPNISHRRAQRMELFLGDCSFTA